MKYNIDAERALIGSLLCEPEKIDTLPVEFDITHIYDGLHQAIVKRIIDSHAKGINESPLTLKASVGLHPSWAEMNVDPVKYLAGCAEETTASTDVHALAVHVTELYKSRTLAEALQEATDALNKNPDATADDVAETVQSVIYEATTKRGGSGCIQRIGSVAQQSLNDAEDAYRRQDPFNGVPTGLTDLDASLGGLQNTDLVILAGRPGMGKSALAVKIGVNSADSFRRETEEEGLADPHGKPVLFFSLEMGAKQIADRIHSDRCSITLHAIKNGTLNENQFEGMIECANWLNKVPFYIDDTGGLSLAQIAARSRRAKKNMVSALLSSTICN